MRYRDGAVEEGTGMSDDNGRRLPSMPNPQMRAFYAVAVTWAF